MRKLLPIALIGFLTTLAACQEVSLASPLPSISIGSVGFNAMARSVDPIYKQKLNAAGYQVGGLDYSQVSSQTIKPFNLVIAQWCPGEGDTHGSLVYDKAIPILEQYLQQGGGLLVTYEHGGGNYKALNRLLRPLDAEVLDEDISDEKNSFTQKTYLGHTFATTTNLDHDSPLTAGIDSFIYPEPGSGGGGWTAPLRLSSDWQPSIRGEQTAHSPTFPHAPVMVASRQYGRGRIVVMSIHTTFFFNAGYHQVWEGITMEKGHGARFLDNAYHWLAGPSLQSGAFGGYHQAIKPGNLKPVAVSPDDVSSTDEVMKILNAGFRKPVPHVPNQPERRIDYIGLVGAHTSYSSGRGTVQQYAAHARARGFQFIVFTEDLSQMNEDRWIHLTADCKSASSSTFVALPGLDYYDLQGSRYIGFNFKKWPNKEWLSPDGKRVKDAPGLYFGEDWAAISLISYDKQYVHPWTLKFFSGMAPVSYPRGASTPVTNFADYLQVQANNYNLIPLVNHDLYAPGEVDSVSGFQSHALARSIEDIHRCYRNFWYGNRYAYVSEGPRLAPFAIRNGWLAEREEEWRLPLDIQDDAPITDVVIYDQKRIFYHFRPGARRFTTLLRGYHDQQRFLTMVVTDARGRSAYSSCCYTADISRQSIKMCTDQQNTLNGMGVIHPDNRVDYANVMGNYNTNWDGLGLGILGGDIMPPGLDYVVGGWGGGVAPVCRAKQGDTNGGVAQRDIVFACGDVNILDNYFNTRLVEQGNAPTDQTDSSVRFISFTPRLNSYNMMILQDRVKFKKALTFDNQPGPELRLMDVSGPNASFLNLSFIGPDGQKQTGPREPGATLEKLVPRGGYMAAWPDFYGSVALYPLQRPAEFLVQPGFHILAGQKMAGQSVRAGETLEDAYLVVRGKFGENTDAGFNRIRDLYGLDGTPAYSIHLSQGQVLSLPLVPQLEASRYTAAGVITPASLPNDLGVQVKGINANWDAGLYDKRTGTLRRIGVFEGCGYFRADTTGGLNFVSGNLLVCNEPEARLHLIIPGGPSAEIEAHNPTARSMLLTIQGSERIPLLAGIKLTIHLKPGETQTLPIHLPGPAQWSEAGVCRGSRSSTTLASALRRQ